MATVNHSRQSLSERDTRVASAANNARQELPRSHASQASALRADSPESVRSGSDRLAYPVLLHLADASVVPADDLVHVAPLMVESAMEAVGSGKASPTGNPAHSFASLLAASPSLQRSPSGNRPSSSDQKTDRQIDSTTSQASEADRVAPAAPAERQLRTEESPAQRLVDRAVLKPLRRPFKLTRPAWIPEIPPTLVLGLLICFTALLIGMLWRGDGQRSDSQGSPVAHDKQPAEPRQATDASTMPAKVAAVPSVPEVVEKKKDRKVAQKATAAKPTDKKLSANKPKASNQRHVEVAQQKRAEAETKAEEIPAPRITGIRALPPVESYQQVARPVQPVGQPAPQIVENPHVARQNTVYEARRSSAEFQGTITPPDAAAPNERF